MFAVTIAFIVLASQQQAQKVGQLGTLPMEVKLFHVERLPSHQFPIQAATLKAEQLTVMPRPSEQKGILSPPPLVSSFSDVATSSWYYGYIEEHVEESKRMTDQELFELILSVRQALDEHLAQQEEAERRAANQKKRQFEVGLICGFLTAVGLSIILLRIVLRR
jgi:hypothetical protein